MFEIKVPSFGESIQEVQVASWLKKPGDWIDRDEEFVELESEKASQALAAERAGVLSEIKVQEGEFAQIGDILCLLDDSSEPVAAGSQAKSQQAEAEDSDDASQSSSETGPHSNPSESSSRNSSASWIMPAAERVLNEYQISADAITPTGPGGRLLKEDVLKYIEQKGLKPGEHATATSAATHQPATPIPTSNPAQPQSAPEVKSAAPDRTAASSNRQASGPAESAKAASPSSSRDSWTDFSPIPTREEKSVPMSMIRRTIAKRLVEAQQTAALLTTFNEIDMHPVKELRSRYQQAFQEKHGVKLGFMSFFAKAAVEGLRRFPAINAEIRDNQVVMKNYHDIGVAIGGGKGLVVPVLRNVERMSFADVERAIGQYAKLAQDNKIQPEDLQGGTFTISNGGIYGSLLSTPIVNPPQSGILGLHSIQDRPIALNGQVVIRPMMYIALTYDHRIVDGREAVGFLKTVKEVLEEPARLFLEV